MKKTKKTRAQQRDESERLIWAALVEFANTGQKLSDLAVLGIELIGGHRSELEDVCRDIRDGAIQETRFTRYREGIRTVLAWLSAPEKGPAEKACRFLRNHANTIRMVWTRNNYYDPKDPNDPPVLLESPKKLGSVVAPICKFIKEQIDRHDLRGVPLRDVIPIGMCDRPGCGKFRMIKLYRPGLFFCSNLCKASFHQANKKEEKAEYMRVRREKENKDKPKGIRHIVRRGRRKKTADKQI
jgi:hypothetical protein